MARECHGAAPLARCGDVSRRGGVRPLGVHDAPRGHPLAHGGSATLAELKTSGQPVYGSFPARDYRRGTREQRPD